MSRLVHKTYRLRWLASRAVAALLRKPVLRLHGMAIGTGIVLESFGANGRHIGDGAVIGAGAGVKVVAP